MNTIKQELKIVQSRLASLYADREALNALGIAGLHISKEIEETMKDVEFLKSSIGGQS
ncbi:MAG: hypothetical protein ACN2B6_01215 [Rickettsiales bacterium]